MAEEKTAHFQRKPFNLKLFLAKIYALKFINAFTLLSSVYAIMFKDSGLSDMTISGLFILWSAVIIIMQIPSGILADKYNRRNVLIAGQLAKMGAFMAWVLMPNVIGYAAGFVLWGVQGALHSGTFEAFLYDELKRDGKENLYAKIYGKAFSFDLIGYAAILPLGTLALGLGYEKIILISIATVGISAIILATMKYTKRNTLSGELASLKILKDGLGQIWRSNKLFYYIILLAVIVGFAYIDKYYGLISMEMGVAKKYVGFVMGAIFVMQSIGSWIAYMFEGLKEKSIYFFAGFGALMFGSVTFFYNLTGIYILTVSYLFFSIARTLFLARIQHITTSDSRATVISIYGLIEQAAMIGGYGVIMFALKIGGYRYAFGMLAAIILIATAFTMHKLKGKNETAVQVKDMKAVEIKAIQIKDDKP